MKKTLFVFLFTGLSVLSFGQFNNVQNRGNLPDNFPVPEIVFSNNPSPGYFFVSPAGLWGYFPDATPYLVIMDNYGTPVYFSEQSSSAFDFKIQSDGSLTYAFGTPGRTHHVLNDKLELVKDLDVVGYPNDFHDLVVLENGNYLMLANEYRIVDMDTVVEGGQQGVTVIGGVIQIQDSANNVLFHWSTFDHFKITDAADHVDLTSPNSIDYAHINSIDMDSDSTIILSSRNMHELTKISATDGEIIWRMGGKNNMFSFNSDTSIFSGQHDFRKLDNGQYTVFDNNWFSGIEGSRASFYELDEENYEADLVKQYKSFPELIQGTIMGNVQPLPGGNWVVGWGSGDPNFTEFKADGSKVFEVRYDAVSYRAFKFDWKPKAFTFDMEEADFGDVGVSQPATMTVELSNNLQQDIEINYIHQHDTYVSVLNQLPVQIPANDKISIELQFTPGGSEGIFEDLLTFCWDTEVDGLMSQRVAAQLPVRANVSTGNGIEDQLLRMVKVYPNPFNDKIIVESESGLNNEMYVTIINALGQVVYNIRVNQKRMEISTENLPEGFYQLLIRSGNNLSARKLIKY